MGEPPGPTPDRGKEPGLTPVSRVNELTARETEIVSRLAGGQRPTVIAVHCHISVHTVRNHLKSIYRKLDVHSQLELVSKLRGSWFS